MATKAPLRANVNIFCQSPGNLFTKSIPQLNFWAVPSVKIEIFLHNAKDPPIRLVRASALCLRGIYTGFMCHFYIYGRHLFTQLNRKDIQV